MKKIIFMLLSIFAYGFGFGQTLYIDPTTSAAMAAHAGVINKQMGKTNDNLTLLQRGQLAVTGQLAIVNDMQDKIYKGLSEVSSVINNLISIKEIANIGIDIVGDVEKTVDIAKSNPALLLFAEQGAREFKVRATNLAIEVQSFVLKGGKNNLMDSGERSKLLNHIASEMRILRGTAYGMHRAMYWAKMRGIWASLNPWAEWQNMDVRIANDVLNEAKYLKK
ncbi:hypothetical protein FA048_12710 [Pedobacter polaris]|uniref:Plasmid transfer protein n=1 Tax=Pedobacter polaris TaxID=2571273 RepID=A0A4U1CN63_9SPHI|nr:hypothetical protein [Pedobacter polaris]TKC08018.1 hypothetical protein FA048_12710 [Pedobacter polaris]